MAEGWAEGKRVVGHWDRRRFRRAKYNGRTEMLLSRDMAGGQARLETRRVVGPGRHQGRRGEANTSEASLREGESSGEYS